MHTTMHQMFTTTFDNDDVLHLAREVGALKRLRDIHPADLCLAITHCAMGDETRSIATARRDFHVITGYMPEESSFYDRFTKGLVALMKYMFEHALSAATREQREVLAAALMGTNMQEVRTLSPAVGPQRNTNSRPREWRKQLRYGD